MQQVFRSRVACLSFLSLTLALTAACGGSSASPTPQAARPTTAPTAAPTDQSGAGAQPTTTSGSSLAVTPVAPVATVGPQAAPAATAAAEAQPGGLRTLLPLTGEFAVTGNADDQTLSVVPIGSASVALTVQLDLAPHSIGAAPNSDVVAAVDTAPSTHTVTLTSLDSSTELGSVDLGGPPEAVAGPPPNGPDEPLLVVSDVDNTIRPLDATSRELGPAVQLGAGPHVVNVAKGGAMLTPQIFVANAGDGTVSVLDDKATAV